MKLNTSSAIVTLAARSSSHRRTAGSGQSHGDRIVLLLGIAAMLVAALLYVVFVATYR
ncbi:hypothetical protein [Methylocystis heyeri]|uniref:Uncharacterized protein n=1 Tax=Methylocystis heyeri TaxID=391905 RepID=A0A6B8KCE2_9HYPH|nr:hypothetical protein [Methylocystis heyeri]QGM46094.1 hypothetical protein H2LOC_010535 [Methylocystis heyeri]